MPRPRLRKRLVRRFGYVLTVALLVLVTFCGVLVARNNADSQEIGPGELTASLDRAIEWLTTNQSQIEKVKNPILSFMLRESKSLTGREELGSLFDAYMHRQQGAVRKTI